MLIYGDRVRSARLLRGISASAVAAALGWSSPTQTRLEALPSQDLSGDQLVALTRILEVPENYLSTAPPHAIAASELLFRAPVRTTKREKGYLAEYARLVGEVLDWLDTRHRLPPVKIPALPASTDIVDAAKQARAGLDLDAEQPIPHLVHRAERAGVIIIVRDAADAVDALYTIDNSNQESPLRSALREDHHAYSIRVGELRERPIIVARAHRSWERTRLTIAHELGHLVLHGRELAHEAEQQAFAFAAELLAPSRSLRPMLPNPVTLAELVPIKMHFGISLGALIKHLLRAGLITEARHKTLESQLYRRQNSETGVTWGRQEPGWDLQDPERPKLMSAWLERCVGTSQAGAVTAGALPHIPVDLMSTMLSGQRRPTFEQSAASYVEHRSVSKQVPASETAVVDLASRRARTSG